MYIANITKIDEFIASIKEESKKFSDIENPSISDGEKMLEYSQKIINTFILTFGSQIKDIYNKIENNEFPYNKIKTYGISKVFKKYEEYSQGMHKFIYKMFDANTEDFDDDSYVKERIKKVYKLDKVFLSNLFDDNEKQSLLSYAISDIETVIDISKFIKYENDKINDMCSNTPVGDMTKYCSSLTSLYISSIIKFICKMLSYIFITYKDLVKSIERRTPIKEVEKQPYVLI